MVREFSVLSLPRELVQSLLGELRADKLSEVPPGPPKRWSLAYGDLF